MRGMLQSWLSVLPPSERSVRLTVERLLREIEGTEQTTPTPTPSPEKLREDGKEETKVPLTLDAALMISSKEEEEEEKASPRSSISEDDMRSSLLSFAAFQQELLKEKGEARRDLSMLMGEPTLREVDRREESSVREESVRRREGLQEQQQQQQEQQQNGEQEQGEKKREEDEQASLPSPAQQQNPSLEQEQSTDSTKGSQQTTTVTPTANTESYNVSLRRKKEQKPKKRTGTFFVDDFGMQLKETESFLDDSGDSSDLDSDVDEDEEAHRMCIDDVLGLKAEEDEGGDDF